MPLLENSDARKLRKRQNSSSVLLQDAPYIQEMDNFKSFRVIWKPYIVHDSD